MVIIVFGLPGSGKSFFASRLADSLQAKYINSDIIRQDLIHHQKYSPNEKKRVYEQMLVEMKEAIAEEKDIVLDATFYKAMIREAYVEMAGKLGKKILFMEICSDEETIKERLDKKRLYSEADYSVYLKIKEAFEPLKEDHLILKSTQHNINEMLKKATDYINMEA